MQSKTVHFSFLKCWIKFDPFLLSLPYQPHMSLSFPWMYMYVCMCIYAHVCFCVCRCVPVCGAWSTASVVILSTVICLVWNRVFQWKAGAHQFWLACLASKPQEHIWPLLPHPWGLKHEEPLLEHFVVLGIKLISPPCLQGKVPYRLSPLFDCSWGVKTRK